MPNMPDIPPTSGLPSCYLRELLLCDEVTGKQITLVFVEMERIWRTLGGAYVSRGRRVQLCEGFRLDVIGVGRKGEGADVMLERAKEWDRRLRQLFEQEGK